MSAPEAPDRGNERLTAVDFDEGVADRVPMTYDLLAHISAVVGRP